MKRSTRWSSRRVLPISLTAVLVALRVGLLRAATAQQPQPGRSGVSAQATGPSGQTGPIVYATPNHMPTVGTPTSYGPFRLVPYGYNQPLSHIPVASPTVATGTLQEVNDPLTITRSSLYLMPSSLPQSYHVTRMSGVGYGDAEAAVQLHLEGNGHPITIAIWRYTETPIDVDSPASDGVDMVDTLTINGMFAAITHPKPAFPQGYVEVRLIHQDILIDVSGHPGFGLTYDDFLNIARSMPIH